MPVLQAYNRFVREHPNLVANLERLAHLLAYAPDRFFSGSEFGYEAFNAAVGLIGLYNDSLLNEKHGRSASGQDWGLWLAAVEQVGRGSTPMTMQRARQRSPRRARPACSARLGMHSSLCSCMLACLSCS
jgi:hypothetical protein